MFELNRTGARWAFKDLLGQANHFLITILVGLNGVRDGKVGIDPEFRASWNPKDIQRSVERSRVFALDLALVRAIDALDTYMMMSARKPCALPHSDFIACMNGTGRSVRKRLAVFNEHLPALGGSHSAVLYLAIEWRNRRVHSLACDTIEKSTIDLAIADTDKFNQGYSGLDIDQFVHHYKSGDPPTFKEAASIIRLCHEAVSHFDAHLLNGLEIERYVKESALMVLQSDTDGIAYSCARIWDHPKRKAKALRLLRLAGVNETETLRGRRVPDSFVESFVNLEGKQVVEFLSTACA